MREWVTVREAAVLVGRHVSQIYRWIDAGLLATRKSPSGATEVLAKAVVRIEPGIKPGRPRGSASSNTKGTKR